MDREGYIQRFINYFNSLRTGKQNTKNNIFIPTGALQLFTHINKIASNHHVILADFDSFILPKAGLRGDFKYGLNPPIVTNKLSSPSSWETFDTYIVPKGKADIGFATDFYFLNHAYKSITKKNGRILKNMEMFDDFSIPSWGETYNGYNPMREEYINTSFLIS